MTVCLLAAVIRFTSLNYQRNYVQGCNGLQQVRSETLNEPTEIDHNNIGLRTPLDGLGLVKDRTLIGQSRTGLGPGPTALLEKYVPDGDDSESTCMSLSSANISEHPIINSPTKSKEEAIVKKKTYVYRHRLLSHHLLGNETRSK
ncbi:6414_t:CDS:2 [Ambispora gerdemannii]|uniref:6414_t:CDS:1 n=1 Tax=Ambispora gerdemannii TaxID=144530 RepID=A0A9N9B7N5_9GLOM|nr:6414_t:CDS:2 [Ambispora gerdemannii]